MSRPGIRTMGIVATIRSMLAAALALVALAAPAAAQTFPALSGRVVDAAHVLSPGVSESLAALAIFSDVIARESGRSSTHGECG